MDITEALLDQFNTNSLYTSLGIRIKEAGDGKARARLEPNPKHCWPFPGQPHGGILFTLMDITMAWAVFSGLEPDYNCATIHLDIQYSLPAKGPYFKSAAWVTHRTGRMSFLSAEIRDEKDQVVAMGQGTFRIIEMTMTV